MANISDVARLAGVSPATVSRVLNRPEIVAAAKRQQVLDAIDELGFEPSVSARSLRTGSTRSIALLVGDISQAFHGAVAKSVALEAESAGYSVMLGDLDHRRDRLVAFLRSMIRRNVDGVIIATAEDIADHEVLDAIDRLVKHGIAVVSTVEGIPQLDVPRVRVDYTALGGDAVRHLIDLGCEHLLYVGGGQAPFSGLVETGVRREVRRNRLSVEVVDGRFQAGVARAAVRDLLASGRPVDGVVAANAPMAVGALRALTDLGRRVPDDVGLICCESVPSAEFVAPSLSTIGCDLNLFGRSAARAVLDAIEGGESRDGVRLPYQLTQRESTSRIARTD